MYDGQFIQFSNYQANVPASIAYRMSRISNFTEQEFEIPKQSLVPYDPDSWHKDKRVIWSSNIASASGFGSVTEHVLLALLRNKIKVQNPGSISGDIFQGGEFVNKEVEKSLYKIIEPDCLEIQYCQPQSLRFDIIQRIWTYAMFETTHTPRSWIKKLNGVERILVPSSWLIESWHEQGVTVPISVFHHGIDPKIYSYMDRPIDRDKYTFLQFGELDRRKGTDIVFKAFADEFKEQDDVQLVLKTNKPGIVDVPLEYPGLVIIRSPLSKKQMIQLMFDADCFVFPTRGEGFGLTPLEAMATGLPTIITGWSGPADFADPDDTMIVSHTMKRAYQFDIIYKTSFEEDENSGDWAEPSYEEVRHYMRWCYENREKAKEKGKKAAERIAKDWTWEAKVKNQLIPLFNEML